MEEYLKQHQIGQDNYAIHYDNLKSAIVGSINGQVTTDGKSYFKYGLTGNEFQKKYGSTKDFEELALFGNNTSIGTIIQ